MRECVECGVEFAIGKRQGRRITCGDQCRTARRVRLEREWWKSHWNEKRAERPVATCVWCGDEFPKVSKRHSACSPKCRDRIRAAKDRLSERRCYKCGVLVPEAVGRPGATVCADCKAHETRKNNAQNERRRTLRKYSISEQVYQDILAAQGGVCAICGSADPNAGMPVRRTKYWAIDHDHGCCPGNYSCGDCVRGLLCCRCNTGIGWFDEDPDVLLAAVSYIQRSDAA